MSSPVLQALAIAMLAWACTGTPSAEETAPPPATAGAADGAPADTADATGATGATGPTEVEPTDDKTPLAIDTTPPDSGAVTTTINLDAPTIDPQAPPLDAEDPTLLRRPYTVEQLRAAWVPGFQMTIRTWADGLGEQVRVWRVIEANAEGATVEITERDSNGVEQGPRMKDYLAWQQLRDNVMFPVGQATLEDVTVDTELGRLDCSRYSLWDEARGTVAEFLFARDRPGLPITIEVRQDGKLVATTAQIPNQ